MDLLVDDIVEKNIKSESFVMNNSEVLHNKHCISVAGIGSESNIPFYTKSGEDASNDLNTYKAENSNDYRKDLNVCQHQKLDTDHEINDVVGSGSIDDRCGGMSNDHNDGYKNECAHFTTSTAQNTLDMTTQNQPADTVFFPPTSSGLQYAYNFSHRTKFITNTTGGSVTIAPNKSNPHEQVRNQGFHYPNMWYPNTPYNSGRIFSSHGMNRFQHNESAGACQRKSSTDGHHLSNSGREARNRAEKNRRDKLNGSIQELSTLVPHVAESPRRVDKTAVLRLAAHGLRLHYTFRDKLNLNRPQLTDSLMNLLDSIFITLTSFGQIILISSSIEQHLGHCQIDLYGQNILSITHPEDHDLIKHELVPSNLEDLFGIQTDSESCETKQRTQSEEESIDQKLREDRRSFTVRLARAGPRSEPTSYELVKLDGCFRRSDSAPRGFDGSAPNLGIQLLRRNHRREDTTPLHAISGNDIIFVAIARVIRPPNLFKKILEANSLEYKTRHLIDGRIIDCDQRIGVVAGYMTEEVKNLSPFTFMHQDDVRWVIVALRQMYDCNSSYGESTYRLLTRNGYFIYLQSKGYLEIDKKSNTVHSFVCINTLLDEEEGKRRVDEMKRKFSVIINKQIPTSSVDVPASENPQQLVKAVLCLIQNLQKSTSVEESFNSTTQFANTMPDHPLSPLLSRSAKTPPLALVPPEPASVKTSISKSVSVVNVTAAKHLLEKKSQQAAGNEQLSSPGASPTPCETGSFNGTCEYQGDDMKCGNCERMSTQSSLLVPFKHKSVCPLEGNKDLKIIKRRFENEDIHHVIFSSLDKLGRSLQEQQSAAFELQDQSNIYEVPHARKRIKAIMEECQIQNEMFVSLTNEIQNQGSIEASPTRIDQQHEIDLVP